MSVFSSFAFSGNKTSVPYEIIPPGQHGGAGRRRNGTFRTRSSSALYKDVHQLTFRDLFSLTVMIMFAGYFMIGALVGLFWPLFVFT